MVNPPARYDMLPVVRAKQDPSWRKAQKAARLLARAKRRPLTVQERRSARALAADPGVTNRLIDQALASLAAPASRHVPAKPTVETEA